MLITLPLRVRFVSWEQPKNAPVPMLLTLSGIVTLVNLLWESNAIPRCW